MTDAVSSHAAIDRYLADGYARVRGMSSRFAAGICGHVIRRQSELGISGDVVEIGTYEGRFFIALALGLAPGEHALGMDVFDWPDPGVQQRMIDNCLAHGLDERSLHLMEGVEQGADARRSRPEARRRPQGALHPCRPRTHA